MTARKILPAVSVALQHDDRLLLVGAVARLRSATMPFRAGASKRAKRWKKPRGANSPRKPGLSPAMLSPLVRVPVEGDEVDYDLQVFFGRYAGGEPIAADDAAEATFFTLAEMEALPMPISVLEVGRNLLGK